MDGMVAAGEALLWPGDGTFCLYRPASILVCAVGMATIQGVAAVAGQHRLIHWDRQSMANPRW